MLLLLTRVEVLVLSHLHGELKRVLSNDQASDRGCFNSAHEVRGRRGAADVDLPAVRAVVLHHLSLRRLVSGKLLQHHG